MKFGSILGKRYVVAFQPVRFSLIVPRGCRNRLSPALSVRVQVIRNSIQTPRCELADYESTISVSGITLIPCTSQSLFPLRQLTHGTICSQKKTHGTIVISLSLNFLIYRQKKSTFSPRIFTKVCFSLSTPKLSKPLPQLFKLCILSH